MLTVVVIINLDTIFRVALILFVASVRKLKLLPISSFTVVIAIEQVITKLLLFGNEILKAVLNKSILTSTIEFLQATERFTTSSFN